VEPVAQVVAVQETRVGAARKAAASVAQRQGATNGGWNLAAAAADTQLVGAASVARHGHQAAVAGDAAKRFRGKCARQSLGKEDAM